MKKISTEYVIEMSKKVHGDKYDYSKIKYINYNTKITVICKKHGDFNIRTDHFLHGCGCQKCSFDSRSKNQTKNLNTFIEEARKIHGNKYDYSKVKYKNAKTKICIICPEHGEFWQIPDSHLKGSKCPKCNTVKNNRYTIEEFIERAKQVHGDKYDYSKSVYINRITKICIVCPEHGEFWQTPDKHINRKHGCPFCNESHLEEEIRLLLNNNDIKYETQKRFNWLRDKYPMPVDFYLPDYNIVIECQGEQHFKENLFFTHYDFEKRLNMDISKKELCEKNGIKILYFSNKYFVPKYWDKYDVICSKEKLLNIIKNNS